MKIISLVYVKGGCGKSLLSQAIAVHANAGKGHAALIDADPLQSTLAWASRRTEETPLVIGANSGNLEKVIEAAQADGIKYLIIDTPPHVGSIIDQVVRQSDLIIMPIWPTPSHLDAVEQGWKRLKSAKRVLGVLNMVPTDSSADGDEAVEVVNYHAPDLKLAKTRLHQRKPFWKPQAGGQAISDQAPTKANQKAQSEIQGLWNEIKKELK